MNLYLFDRSEKIIHFEDLSILNEKNKINSAAELIMSENEVFVFQVAALSGTDDVIKSIEYDGNLKMSCINTDVRDKYGKIKKQTVILKKDVIQPLFFTVEADKIGNREENETLTIVTEKKTVSVNLLFHIISSPVENNGYNDINTLSRLKWLNSDMCIDDTVIKPYISPEADGDTLKILGRSVSLTENGLPFQVYSNYSEAIEVEQSVQKELFAKPCEFVIEGSTLPIGETEITKFNNRIECLTKSDCNDYSAEISSILRYDGVMEYSVKITPRRDFSSDNVSLDFYINKDCSDLMHGLGHRASKAENLDFKWDNDKQQDCIFIGSVNCGMRAKFKAENYRRPLVNIFYKNLPLNVPETTWDNCGRGGIKVDVQENCIKLSAFTGKFDFKTDETRNFIFELHFTPLKPIDYKKAFTVRYSHNNALKDEIKEIDTAEKNGLNYVTFHQGNMIMPFINYPFYEVDRLKNAVNYAKKKGIGIKLYYTEREHSNHMAETFVYKALGDEIILRKPGVSHSWQKEKPQWLIDNFGDDIISGWYVKYKHGKYKNDHDISFIVRPDTRLDNYYIEGLNWLVDNVGIKGIYIDDTSLDRITLERAKKVLSKTDGLIDMHMWNHEEPRAGDVSCMNLYTEILPFLDSVWLGEGFFYKKYSPEYMLAEVSGIPYGLTGQMLEGGGDFYIGMLYAMNNRFGWGHTNAVQMYKIWDDFDIVNSKMLGYWHSENPVKTNNKNVLSTVYLKNNSALVCLYNFDFGRQKFELDFNIELLGFVPKKASEIRFGKSDKKIKNMFKTYKLGKRKGIIIKLEG